MANSDWAREPAKKPEQKWFYFQPVLGQIPESDWQFGCIWDEEPTEQSWLPVEGAQEPIHKGDLTYFWRKPYTSKGN